MSHFQPFCPRTGYVLFMFSISMCAEQAFCFSAESFLHSSILFFFQCFCASKSKVHGISAIVDSFPFVRSSSPFLWTITVLSAFISSASIVYTVLWRWFHVPKPQGILSPICWQSFLFKNQLLCFPLCVFHDPGCLFLSISSLSATADFPKRYSLWTLWSLCPFLQQLKNHSSNQKRYRMPAISFICPAGDLCYNPFPGSWISTF